MRISITSTEGIPTEMLLHKYPFLKEYLYVGPVDPEFEKQRQGYCEETLFITMEQFCELQEKFDEYYDGHCKTVDDLGNEDYDVGCVLSVVPSAVDDPNQKYCIVIDDIDLIRV